VVETPRNGFCGSPEAEVDCGKCIAHLVRPITAIRCVALAQLARVVVAPALDRIVIEERTGVKVTCRNGFCGSPEAEVDCGKCIAHLVRPITAPRCVALAQLAVAVVAPALDRIVIEERAGVVETRRNGFCGSPEAEVDCGKCRAHLVQPITAIRCVALTQLAVAVAAPALDRIVIEERTGVKVTRRNGFCGSPEAEVDCGKCIAHLVRPITAKRCVALAQLAVVVVAPALDRIVIEERTGVVGTPRNGFCGSPEAEVDCGKCIAHLVRPITAGAVSPWPSWP